MMTLLMTIVRRKPIDRDVFCGLKLCRANFRRALFPPNGHAELFKEWMF